MELGRPVTRALSSDHSVPISGIRNNAPAAMKTITPERMAASKIVACCQKGALTRHSDVLIAQATAAMIADAVRVEANDGRNWSPSIAPRRRVNNQASTAASTSDESEFEAAKPLMPKVRKVNAEQATFKITTAVAMRTGVLESCIAKKQRVRTMLAAKPRKPTAKNCLAPAVRTTSPGVNLPRSNNTLMIGRASAMSANAAGMVIKAVILNPDRAVARSERGSLIANCAAKTGKITVAMAAANNCCGKPTTLVAYCIAAMLPGSKIEAKYLSKSRFT